MPKKRQLAAIMFTDIEGYTALMQGDEAQALHFREGHRKIFNTTTEKHGGKILQYYGDGTLSIFDSAIEAVECGIEMQLAFINYSISTERLTGIPIRIGIHSGDIIFNEDEIIGDSVNVAARIESLATTGSVFISDKVYDEIKNQNGIETRSMGLFALKNVKKQVEIFAISNDGLVVPNPDQIQGKAKKVSQSDGIFVKLWNRGLPQLAAGYFGGIWGVIQFTDWVLNRYQISPYWTDVMLVFFLSLVPSLLVYLWKKDRVNQGELNWSEKLIFPGNIIASILLLFILFKGTDLGATTETVNFNNEDGVEQSRTIIKSDFRKRLAIHNFIPEKEDSIHQWMSWGIHAGIAEDLSQNEYLSIGFWGKTQSLQEVLSLSKADFYNHSLTGSYSVDGETYKITTKLYNTLSGSLQKSHTYIGQDFFALIDTISMVTKKDLGFTQNQIDLFVDLPFADAFTFDINAYKNYSLFFWASKLKYLEQAISQDTTFAIASYARAQYLFSWSSSLLGAKEAINQGMRHRKRLPDHWKSHMKTLYFQINNQPEKAIALLQMQLEMDPGNQNKMETLSRYFYLTNQYEALLAWRKKLSLLDPNPKNQIDVVEALLLNGKSEEAGQILINILTQYPNQPDAITTQASYYAITGQVDKADSLLQKIIILDPEIELLALHYFKAFQYRNDHPQTPDSLRKYEGHYRLQERAAEYDIHLIENLLYGKARSLSGGFFFMTSAADELMIGGHNSLEKWKFVSDSSDRFYKIQVQGIRRGGQTYNNVLWRQDSLIRKAMGLFSIDKKTEALAAYRIAYYRNPQHFYLAQYIKHLEFVLDPNNKMALKDMITYEGRYGDRHIWLDHDNIYYERKGQVGKQRLLPVSPDLFYFWGGFQFQMQVVVEDGEVQGTVSWEYDETSGEFVRDDTDYLEFDKLKD